MAERITVKSPSQIEKMRVAGRLVGETLNFVGSMIAPGVSTYELDREAEAFIRKHGGISSFLNYNGFPASLCTSINEQVVHGIPSKKIKLREGDIISVDCGAIVDGWHGDAARTFLVGEVDEKVRKLVEVTRECFFLGAEQAVEGNHLIDIARAVETHAREFGYGVIREMVGHGIGTHMHEAPEVPNYVDIRMGKGAKLVSGMTLAIEPMISLGTWRLKFAPDGWTASTADVFSPFFSVWEATPAMLPLSRGETEKLTITSSDGTAACASVVSNACPDSSPDSSAVCGEEHPAGEIVIAAQSRISSNLFSVRMKQPRSS